MNKFYIILFEIYIYLFSNAVGIRAYSVASGSVIVIGSLLAYAFSIVWDGDTRNRENTNDKHNSRLFYSKLLNFNVLKTF